MSCAETDTARGWAAGRALACRPPVSVT